ncbi:MAG: hypothetical protein FJX76_14980, partial [Armatimonadetes bacterium]|nr:hypothetical protein [Armatimonadota bacterium]
MIRASVVATFDSEVTMALDHLQGRANTAREFEYLQRLAADCGDFARAAPDLELLQSVIDAHPQIPAEQVLEFLGTFRKAESNNPSATSDLRKPMEHVAAQSNPRAMVEAIVGLQVGGRNTKEAFEFEKRLEALGCPATAVRSALVLVLAERGTYEDGHLLSALDALKGRKDAEEGYRAFLALMKVTTPEQAENDLRDMLAVPGMPLVESGTHAVAFRKVDPNRNRNGYNRTYCSLRGVLEHVAAAPDRSAAGARLLALQQGGRDAAQTLEFDRRLEALPCADGERLTIRGVVTGFLKNTDAYYDGGLLKALDALQGRARVADEFAAFQAMHAIVSNFDQAGSDLRTAQKLSEKIPLAEALGHLSACRQADSGRGTDLKRVLSHVMSQTDAGAREAMRQALIGLQRSGRTAEQALEHQIRLEALGCPTTALRPAYEKLLAETYSGEDDTLLGMLDALKGRADGEAGFKAFNDLGVTNRRTALGDLKAVIAAADAHHVEVSDIAAHAVALRSVDPQRQQYQPNYCTLDAVLSHIAQAPSTAGREERRAQLIAFQQQATSRSMQRAVNDLALVQKQQHVPFAEALGHVLALHGSNGVQVDFDKPLAHILAQPDAGAREKMRAAIMELQAGSRDPVQALAHQKGLETLGCSGLRGEWIALLKDIYSNQDRVLLGVLDALKG